MSKRIWFCFFCLFLLLIVQIGAGSAAANLPLTDSSIKFIANQGQWDEAVRFQATTADGVLWLTDDALWLSKTIPEAGQLNIRLTFAGQNTAARLEPFDQQETVVSFFRGSDPDQWQGAVPVWGGVRIRDLYPGVDLLLRGQNGALQPEFVGAVGRVTMQVEGADEVLVRGRELHFITPSGSLTWPLPTTSHPLILEITTPGTHHAPRTTHQIALSPQSSLLTPQSSVLSNSSPLIFGTYIGGDDVLPDVPNATTTDNQGNIYNTGYTESPIFPNEPGLSPQHGIDVIITKLLADGSDLAYAIHINPSAFNQPDYGYDILVNNSGEAYVVGEASSFDFPTTPGAMDTTFNDGDGFFLKVAADGASLLYSTFLGGSDLDGVRGLAQDNQGNFYLTGQTWSTDYPVTTCLNSPPTPCHKGVREVFVTKLNPGGTAILYSTLLGGATQEQGQDIVVDGTGQATITGWTNSSDFPTTSGAYDETFNGEFDVFVTRLNAAGTALVYSTFVGGDNEDRADTLVLHDDGQVSFTGTTLCPCTAPFPTTPGAYDTSHNGNYDGFAAALSPDGSTLIFSTFLGGSSEDRGHGLTLTGKEEIVVIGTTHSTGFPLSTDAFDNTLGGTQDAFLTVLNSSASQVLYSTFLGGSLEDEGAQVLLDAQGAFILAGKTRSADFPVTPGAYNTTLNGDYDMFIVKLALGFVPPAGEMTYLPLLIRR